MSHQVVRFRLFVISCLLIITSACSLLPGKEPFIPPQYPPAPETPRFIFETTLRSSNDITKRTFGDAVREFATGIQNEPTGFSKPYGIAVSDGRIFVTDTQQRAVVVFDIKQRSYKLIGADGEGSLRKPLGIDVSINKEVFVADVSAQRVIVFDFDGNYRRQFGSEALLDRPVSVTISPDGKRAYVVDTGGLESERHRVQIFDANTGQHLATIGKRGTGPGEFNLPLQAAVAPNGTIYVVDGGNFRIQAFDANGKFVSMFGSIGRRSGQFSRPKGISVDREGNVYVVDTAFGNFQIFNPNGELLLYVGARATSGGPGFFSLPAGIDVDEDGRIYVVDQFFRKVDIFRPESIPAREIFAEKY